MNAWALPAAAAAFWVGLLAWEVHPPWAHPWMGMALGLAAIAGAWLAAPRVTTGGDPLREAGLAEREDASVAAIAAPTAVGGSTAHRGPAGAGRSRARRRRMVRRPRFVARRFVAGSARAPPRDGDRCAPFRSRARRVRMARHARRHAGGVARRRRVAARIPVAERRGRPARLGARRRRPSGGRDPPAGRSGLPRFARPPGDGRRAERRRRRTPGAVVEPVHPCGAGVPSIRRPVDRPPVPGAGGRAAPRAGVGGRIAAGRRHDARLPSERARPPVGGVGRERRHGAGADPRAGLAASLDPVAPVRSWRRHRRVLRRDDRRRAVRDASGRHGHDRARGRADRQAARDGFDPGRGGPRAA